MKRLFDELTIDFVRHGQSEENRNKDAYRGAPCDHVALTPKGQYQARRTARMIAKRYTQEGVTRAIMLHGPSARTKQTGAAIAVELASVTRLTIISEKRLGELRLMDRNKEKHLPPVSPGKGLFGRRLEGETRPELEARVESFKDRVEHLARETGIRHFIVSGHNSITRGIITKCVLGLTLDDVEGFPKLGNAHVWRCHAGHVEAIHPEPKMVAKRGIPAPALAGLLRLGQAPTQPIA